MTNLAQKKCVPCEGKDKPYTKEEAKKLLAQIPGWNLNEAGTMISREYNAKNFMEAVKFINQVAQVAESENHHPDIHLTAYRKLRIELSTHAVRGLSENDFILAAKISELPIELKTN
jgi:4a-hydroxytetrahydrobiopterin dehydratase